MDLIALPQPVQEIIEPQFIENGIRLFIKRTDLVHPIISGNKWYKLKYNLQTARTCGAHTLLSFGGAYSNHIHALAGAGKIYGFRTIGIIRGEPHHPLNATLQFATQQGMTLHYLNRSDYRNKMSERVLHALRQQYGDFYLIPEGGSNALAVQGCREILDDNDHYDWVACACGTGATLAGLICANKAQNLLGIAVLKGAEFLYQDIAALLPHPNTHWQLELNDHHGGYAKTSSELLAFIQRFEQQHAIPLDQVYTGKLMFSLYRKITAGNFPAGSRILAIHTGGLQGKSYS